MKHTIFIVNKNLLQNFLLEKKAQLESSIKDIEVDDSLQMGEIEQMAAAAYEYERNRILTVKKNLEEMLSNINRSLQKIINNTYGICDKCTQAINSERLLAIPTANLCINCSSQVSYKSHSNLLF